MTVVQLEIFITNVQFLWNWYHHRYCKCYYFNLVLLSYL